MKSLFKNRFFSFLLTACLLLPTLGLQAAEFVIRDAQTHLADGVYHLEANIRYQFSDPIHEALANGVPITINMQVVIEQQRDYLWNKTLVSLQEQHSVQYHALSGQYIIKNIKTGSQQNFRSLNSALLALGEVRVAVLDKKLLLEPDAPHQVRLRSKIDINALPAPLRPVAWLSYEWKLISEWFVCPLNS